jgi:hypothetical protein
VLSFVHRIVYGPERPLPPNVQAQQARQPHKTHSPGKPSTVAAVGCIALFGVAHQLDNTLKPTDPQYGQQIRVLASPFLFPL